MSLKRFITVAKGQQWSYKISSEVQDLTFTIMTKQSLEERKLRSRNGGKHLFSMPHKKLKDEFAINKLINAWYEELAVSVLRCI